MKTTIKNTGYRSNISFIYNKVEEVSDTNSRKCYMLNRITEILKDLIKKINHNEKI